MKTITIELIVKFQIPDGEDPEKAVSDFWDQEPDIFGDGYEAEPVEDGARVNGEVITGE